MKKWIVLILWLPIFPLFQNELGGVVMAQNTPNKGFVIQGSIEGLAEKSVVTLNNLNNPADTVARTEVKNGTFILKGTIDEPNLYQLNFNAVQKKSVLFLSNDAITLKGNIENVQNIEVDGSTVQKDFKEFQNTFNPLFQQLTEMNQRMSAKPEIQRDDSLMVSYMRILQKIKSDVEQFVSSKRSSPVAPFVLVVTGELEQDPAVVEKRFNLLDEKMKQGFYGKIIKQQIDDGRIGAVGSEAIPFTQNDTAGNPVSLVSFRGKYVLIDFWASWCKPCRMENPNLVTAFDKFKGKNFTVLGVSLDRSRGPWLQAIKDDRLVWTQVSDLKFWNNEAAAKYKIQSIPQNFLLDPSGKIVAKNLRGPELQNKLCELLGCN
ncbi:MAG: AhpC/TSA family protein [Chitinophagaceae bacterium]|nr:AhpC/TSA family protein [Chitinophagaceae bacterium]